MSREEIIKEEAKRILHIALEADDNYEAIDEIEKLLLVERWLFSKCKEPQRTDALNYLNKLGYGGEESE